MPVEFEAMKRKYRKLGKLPSEALKLATKEYNAKYPGKAIGLKTGPVVKKKVVKAKKVKKQ